MPSSSSQQASRLIRRLRRQAGLTQRELAERVGTTQSVISRLESDDYEGHSLSMLYRIAAALDRRIAVKTVGEGNDAIEASVREDAADLEVRESAPLYGSGSVRRRARGMSQAAASGAGEGVGGIDFDRLADRLARRFRAQGVTKADVEEAIRWARHDRANADASARAIDKLRGAIKVGPGDVVDDVRQARVRRGTRRLAGS